MRASKCACAAHCREAPAPRVRELAEAIFSLNSSRICEIGNRVVRDAETRDARSKASRQLCYNTLSCEFKPINGVLCCLVQLRIASSVFPRASQQAGRSLSDMPFAMQCLRRIVPFASTYLPFDGCHYVAHGAENRLEKSGACYLMGRNVNGSRGLCFGNLSTYIEGVVCAWDVGMALYGWR